MSMRPLDTTDYRTLLEGSPAATYVVVFDGDLRTTYASPQLERLLGLSPDELLADTDLFYGRLHPDDRERVRAETIHALSTGEPRRSEYRVMTPEGRVAWVLDQGVAVRDENGGPQALQGVILELPGRRAAAGEDTAHANQLAEEIVRSLASHGLSAGVTLLEVAQVRRALQEADRLLHRLEEAIVRAASEAL